MLSKAKDNLNYLKATLGGYLNAEFKRNDGDVSILASTLRSFFENPKTLPINYEELSDMTPQKNIIQFAIKAIIIFLLISFFIVLPLKNATNKAVEKFNRNPLVKIISLDFIDNPLTFIRLAEHYLDTGKLDHVKLYIEYADTLMAKASYPTDLKLRLEKIRKKLIVAESMAARDK